MPYGFHVLHSHRPIGKRGGGISVISKNSIRLDSIKSLSHSSFELLTAKVSFSSHCLFLSMIYRPPNTGNFIGELTSHLYFLYFLSSNFILAGDFNTPNCTSHDNPLSALLRELELVQHIDFPPHRLGNILDLIITPKPNSHLIQEIGRETFDSDHYLILCSLNLAPSPLPPRIVISRSFENFDDAVFEKDLRHIHNTLTNLSDVPVKEFLTTMNNSFQSLIDHHALFAPTSFAPAVTPITSYPLTPLPPKEKDENLREKFPYCQGHPSLFQPVFLLPSRNLGRLLALSSLNPVLIILTTCLHLSNQTRKFFGKLPTPSYIDLFLLPLAALQKLSIL